MPPVRAVLLAIALCAFIACRSSDTSAATSKPPTSPAGETIWSESGGLRLKIAVYKSAKHSPHPILIVVLHGDLLEPRPQPSYHYEFARRMANQMDDVIVAALLRPGYTDEVGDQSAGPRGLATGDNYTPDVVDAVAQSIQLLKSKFGPAATVLAGHSGGAAITGDLIGRHPFAVNAALMVSCPCDVPSWRKHMVTAWFSRIGPLSLLFLSPVKSLSPLDLAANVPGSVRVRLVVGSADPNTLPKFTLAYAAAVRRNGSDVAVTIAPGLEHNILLEPVVSKELGALVETVRR